MIAAFVGHCTGKYRAIKTVILFFVFFYFVPISFMVIRELKDQIKLLVRNRTWIEKMEKDGLKRRYREAGVALVDEFDTGSVLNNVKCRLGSNPWLWLVPFPNTEIKWSFARNPKYVPVCKL